MSDQATNAVDISAIPSEIWFAVFRMLTVPQAKRAGAVCKTWRSTWADCITEIEVYGGDEKLLRNVCREVIPSKIISFKTDVPVDAILTSYVSTFTNLRIIHATFNITKSDIAMLKSLKNLTDVALDFTPSAVDTCNAIETIKAENPNITSLAIGFRYTNQFPKFYGYMNLRNLELLDRYGVNRDLDSIRTVSLLTSLVLLGSNMDSKILTDIAKLPYLEKFKIEAKEPSAQLTTPDSYLNHLTNLTSLSFMPNNPSPTVIECFGKMTKLKEFNFSVNCCDKQVDFKPLSKLTNLEILTIEMNVDIKPKNDSIIGNYIKLKVLKIQYGPLAEFTGFGALRNLRVIHLYQCTSSQMMQINKLSNVKELSIGGPDLKNFPWRRLALYSLEKLEIREDLCEYMQWRSLPNLTNLSIVLPESRFAKEFVVLTALRQLDFLPKAGRTWTLDRIEFLMDALPNLKMTNPCIEQALGKVEDNKRRIVIREYENGFDLLDINNIRKGIGFLNNLVCDVETQFKATLKKDKNQEHQIMHAK